MTFVDQVYIGTLCNLLGGLLVTSLFVLIQIWTDARKRENTVRSAHAVIQAELSRHAEYARAALAGTTEALAQLPTLDTTALRILPFLGFIDLSGNMPGFVALNAYIDRVDHLNGTMAAQRSLIAGSGLTIEFDSQEVDIRKSLTTSLLAELHDVLSEAQRLRPTFRVS